ncbi:tigger transposable element-derived protein 1-like [Palaemon carinicauda]|uniref:tigger transposable element-derived protein 1-like n=1 Tax=Palaemon carinicauda TaxID=392227 RepID=UPI0035B67A80
MASNCDAVPVGPAANSDALDDRGGSSTMGPKIASDVKRRSKMITNETKLEIIKKYEEGMRIVTLASAYGRNQSTIGTIIKNKEAIKAMETQRDGGDEGTSQQAPQEFKASHGWFDRFRKRTGIHSDVRHGEAASSDKKAAGEFLIKFDELISREGYIPQQVFNCDETSIFWKKMLCHTYIRAKEKKLPDNKSMKDTLTLAFCGNASWDLKLSPYWFTT